MALLTTGTSIHRYIHTYIDIDIDIDIETLFLVFIFRLELFMSIARNIISGT